MTDEQRGSAGWLARQAARDPAAVSRAGRYISGGNRSNDACLRARRFLEWQWRLDPHTLPGGREWRDAAQQLERSGDAHAAATLDTLADGDAELAAAADVWTARYLDHPVTVPETLLAQLLASQAVQADTGQAAIGVDGSWYQLASVVPLPGYDPEAAVLVTTMTGRELVGGFGDPAAAETWLRDRARTGSPDRLAARPLADPLTEHLPRLMLEEHALAWTLRHPGDLLPGGTGLDDLIWTADCRREIAAALRTTTARGERARPPEVAAALSRRLLRAPGWAADQIGWPAGQQAQQYLARLAATAVTDSAARHAAAALTLDATRSAAPDPVLSDLIGRYQAPRQTSVWPALPGTGRPATAHDQRMADMCARYGPAWDRPDSIGARVRLTGPRP